MFAVRRIIRNTKQLNQYICTSGVVKCDETNKKEAKARETKPKKESVGVKTKKESQRQIFPDALSPLRPQRKKRKPEGQFKKYLVLTAEEVADDLGGNKEETKTDLLEYVKKLDVTTERERRQDFQRTQSKWEGEGKPRTDERWVRLDSEGRSRISKPQPQTLNIFQKSIMEEEDKVKLKIWDDLKAEELAIRAKISPRNYFDELIQWTNEGKLWKFPIDNDQDHHEADIDFTEHVFLDKHLKPWCPEKGPLKKFMDLVLIGLSKNPYLTLEEKKEHIKWFEDYFERKRKLLQELGAMGPTKIEASKEETKS